MLRLIVKGSVADAQRAAAERGVTLIDPHASNDLGSETVFAKTDSPERDVAAWFCADTQPAPFPRGSLLHYGSAD